MLLLLLHFFLLFQFILLLVHLVLLFLGSLCASSGSDFLRLLNALLCLLFHLLDVSVFLLLLRLILLALRAVRLSLSQSLVARARFRTFTRWTLSVSTRTFSHIFTTLLFSFSLLLGFGVGIAARTRSGALLHFIGPRTGSGTFLLGGLTVGLVGVAVSAQFIVALFDTRLHLLFRLLLLLHGFAILLTAVRSL